MSKLSRVTLEYDDGTIKQITGDMAVKWEDAGKKVAGMLFSHEQDPFKEIKWNVVKL